MKNNRIENKNIRIEIDMCTLCCAVLSRVQLSATPWTVAHQAPLSMGFPRQEYHNGLASFSRGFFDARFKPGSPALQVDLLLTEPFQYAGTVKCFFKVIEASIWHCQSVSSYN